MVLVGEAEQAGRHALGLEHVEEQDTFADGQTEILLIVHHEVGCRPVVDVQQRVPLPVRRGLVEASLVERAGEVVVHEPQLLAGILVERRRAAIVRHKRLEPAAHLLTLHPISLAC